MLKFRSLVVAATAATVAIGGLTLATTTPADATGWKKRHHGYYDRGVVVDRGPVVRGWFGTRDRDGWFARKWHRKKALKHHRRGVAGWVGRRDHVVVHRRPAVRGWVGTRDRDGWFARKWHRKKAWKHRRGVAGWFGTRERVVVDRRPVVRGWVGRRDRDGWFHRKWHRKKAWKHRRTVVETAPAPRYYRPMK